MLGSVEVETFGDLYDHLLTVTGSESMARSVMGTWSLIESLGWETARGLVSRRTWYRHLKILRKAGLGDADISRGRIVALRRRVLELSECESWDQLRRLVA
jgi:DNA-binding transcriptional ArsR family regulator